MLDIVRFPLMEQFYTIQGEGFHSGKAAYFIRLAGCDVGCVWCDVKDSWHTEGYPSFTGEELAQAAVAFPADMVVITGGEPAMYDLSSLCDALHEKGMKVHIETSGAHTLKGQFDWVCFSPKKFKVPVNNFGDLADELKVVVFNKSDFFWAETHRNEVSDKCKLYLQPEWDKRADMQPLMIDYVLEHPEWEISLQSHKILGVD
jgi:7-carboxy-7-deazaguanine synthase